MLYIYISFRYRLKYSRSSHRPAAGRSSLQPKTLAVSDGNREAVAQLAAARVRGHREQVEARVRVRQLHRVVARALQDEVELRKAADGRAVAAGGEREERALVLGVEGVHDLPEVGDGGVVRAEAVVLGVRLQRVKVEVRLAADELLKLARREEGEGDAVAQQQEALLKGGKRLSHGVDEQVAHVRLHVLGSVVVGHRDAAAARDELVRGALAEHLVRRGEVGEVSGLHVALEGQQRREAAPQGWIDLLQVGELHGGVLQSPPEELGEVEVEQGGVVDGEPEHEANEEELRLLVRGGRREPEGAPLVGRRKEAKVGRQELLDQQLKKLLAHAARIDGGLALEDDLERLEDLAHSRLGEGVERVVDQVVAPHAQHKEGRRLVGGGDALVGGGAEGGGLLGGKQHLPRRLWRVAHRTHEL
mmetsp:Transcript_1980/g.5954  ORF Transcript_1980/g.5954 Transcript_1980/m.5954 type:complete len:418 (-) Transcript_1980:260-1513(-)